MAHGIFAIVKRTVDIIDSDIKSSAAVTDTPQPSTATTVKMGSRRIFTPQFKIQVLDSYRNDDDCKGNQRATARKYGIHRRQIQKWLQCETNLRSSIVNNYGTNTNRTGLNSERGEVINAKSNGNRSAVVLAHHTPPHNHHHHHQYPSPQLYTNTDPATALSLDIGRHSVASNENIGSTNSSNSNTSTSNKYSASYTVLSHHGGYTPVPFIHTVLSSPPSSSSLSSSPSSSLSSTGLPCSPIFSASSTTTKQYKLSDCSLGASTTSNVKPFEYECKSEPLNFDQHPIASESPLYYSDLSPPIATPIDLSVSNRQRCNEDRFQVVSSSTCTHLTWHHPEDELHYTDLSNPAAQTAWDLSFRKRSHSSLSDPIKNEPTESDNTTSGPTPPKMVKLFKPYLLTDEEEKLREQEPKNKQDEPIIWSSYTATASCSPCYDDYNNNNLQSICYDSYGTSNLKYSPLINLPYDSNPLLYSPYYHGLGSPVSGYESASPCYSSSSESGDQIRSNYAIDFRVQSFDQPSPSSSSNPSRYYGIACGSS